MAFLQARLDDDRRRDQQSPPGPETARRHREVEAKQLILDCCVSAIEAGRIPAGATWSDDAAGAEVGEQVLAYLTLPYVDHPDCREEWRPT